MAQACQGGQGLAWSMEMVSVQEEEKPDTQSGAGKEPGEREVEVKEGSFGRGCHGPAAEGGCQVTQSRNSVRQRPENWRAHCSQGKAALSHFTGEKTRAQGPVGLAQGHLHRVGLDSRWANRCRQFSLHLLPEQPVGVGTEGITLHICL